MEPIQIAYIEALKCLKSEDVPVGAVITRSGKIIAKAHNQREKKHNPLYHAEIIVIQKAAKKLKRWHLNDCEIYVTLEPCGMCSNLIKDARIPKVYYGAKDSKGKGVSTFKEINSECLNHLGSSTIIKGFFENRREENKKIKQ